MLTPHTVEMSIRRLDPSVVNKIAAGEIIIQPANALKELLENSIDAGATNIDVLVKDGGLKLLQVTDNGTGIAFDNLPLLCERFATSKLQKYEDLSSMATYGFRGEALASMSHIARLSVTSKRRDAPLAYKAFYSNGVLASPKYKPDNSPPKPIAGKDGTQIVVEDLFFNVSARLQAMRSKSEEFTRILDVVGRYAVHTEIGFSCKKFSDPIAQIATRPKAPLKERVRIVYGTQVASELIEFDFGSWDNGVVKFHGAVSGLSYNNKRKSPPVFFINNRLVQCDPLKRAVASVFSFFLPKGNYPFVYLSLDIVPQNLDVNVHPTKREVRFLHEDDIIEWICGELHDLLSKREGSRTFKQTTLKRSSVIIDEVTTPRKQRQENKLVRVDVQQLKLGFLPEQLADHDEQHSQLQSDSSKSGHQRLRSVEIFETQVPLEAQGGSGIEGELLFVAAEEDPIPSDTQYSASAREWQNVQLESIHDLREDLRNSIYRPLTNVFNNLVYIGIVDPEKRLCCFQYDVKMFLCDYAAVLAEFYYQVALAEFANYGEYIVGPTSLSSILSPLYSTHKDLVPENEVIDRLLSMQNMFLEYFQIDIDGGMLHMLPMLIKDVAPPTGKLSLFFYRLGAKVNYDDEKRCLQEILQQLALLYIPETIPHSEQTLVENLNRALEHVVFPAVRQRLIAPEKLLRDVVQVADLPGLYKVFERC